MSAPTRTFNVGDRVVVTKNYRGAGCNRDMIGYYGHVRELAYVTDEDDTPTTVRATPPMVYVDLKGRIDGQAIHPHRMGRIDRFPVYEFELEHAD